MLIFWFAILSCCINYILTVIKLLHDTRYFSWEICYLILSDFDHK